MSLTSTGPDANLRGLVCPACGGGSLVIDSRPHLTDFIRRRRSCRECGHRWTTYESEQKPDGSPDAA